MNPPDFFNIISVTDDFAFFLLSENGDILYSNKGSDRIFGYDEAEVKDKSINILLHGKAAENLSFKHLKINSDDGQHFKKQTYFQKKDGNVFWGQLTFYRIAKTKEPCRYVLFIFNQEESPVKSGSREFSSEITSETVQQESIRDAEINKKNSFELFIKYTPAAIAMFDKDLRYILVSDRWLKDYGLEGQNIIGKHHYEVFPEIRNMPNWVATHQRCLSGSIESCDEDPFARTDGSMDYIRWIDLPWYETSGEIGGIIMFTEVITEQVEVRKRVEEANQKLTAMNEELKQFTYVASHDLQEPLRTVSSFVQLLKSEFAQELSDDAETYMRFIVDGTKRMKALIDGLLSYSNLDNAVSKKNILLSEVAQRAKQNLYSAILETRAVVTIHSLPAVLGNDSLLEHLFQNLISNAIKYNKEPVPVVNIYSENLQGMEIVCVEDNGIGINPQYREKIFKIFQRLHSSSEHTGSGIGLAISKKIVAIHLGEIWVEENSKGGSCFKFFIQKSD